MIVALTELWENAADTSAMLIDTEKLTSELRELIENAEMVRFSNEYLAFGSTTILPSTIDSVWENAVVETPFSGTIDRVVLFYWE